MVWVGLVTLYGILKGVREILKKKALGRNTVMEVLLMYTLLSFLILLPTAPKAGGLRAPEYAAVFAKSFIIFVAWLCSFHALSCMPVSLYGILDMSRVVFSTLLGIIVIHEKMDLPGLIGFVLVCAGLYALRGLKNREPEDDTTAVVQENATAPDIKQASPEEPVTAESRSGGKACSHKGAALLEQAYFRNGRCCNPCLSFELSECRKRHDGQGFDEGHEREPDAVLVYAFPRSFIPRVHSSYGHEDPA